MTSSDKELEQQLMEAGNRLADPPSSVDELLPLLDQVENCLSRVEQSPSKSMQNSLSPSLNALVADKLFKHSDVDVKVAVASCISEITRITAPDAPYDDDQMKEVFQLIVSSFENLHDKSSRSYSKRTSILETVAKVRSCVVMLDLECDALIIEMFQHFLKAIRDYHPENVFASMETIMALVVEESEDISLELLSPILASVKKDNEEVLPIAQKLGEKVLESCAIKLKPYLIQAVTSLGISLDDYNKVVASICQDMSGPAEQDDVHAANEQMADESKSAGASLDEVAQGDKEIVTEVPSPEQVDPSKDRSPRSVVSNGIAQTGVDDSLADSNLKKQEHGHHTDQSKSMDTSNNGESDGLDTDKIINTENKPEQSAKRRGKKPNSLIKSTEPSDSSHIDAEKDADKLLDHKSSSKDVHSSKDIYSSPHEDPSVEETMSSDNEKEPAAQLSSPKALEGDSMNVASPSPSASLPDENRSRKAGRPKKKESLIKEARPSADDIPRKVSEGTSDSEAKPHKRSGKKTHAGTSNEDKTLTKIDESKKGSGSSSDSEAKPLKQSAKKLDVSSKNGDESSMKQSEDKKRRGRGKAISEKDAAKSSTKDDGKEMVSSPKSATRLIKEEYVEETPKTNSKRKRTPGKEKPSDTKDFGEELLGSNIKVWWPKDQQFYEGVIESFDSVKKKHKVVYTDGDEEILNLKREKWELIGSNAESDEGQEADHTSPVTSSEMPLKKKSNADSDQSTKQGKMDASSKRGGGASSSKFKGAVTKSGRKFKDFGKADGKSKDDSKATSKSEDENSGKTKDHTPKSGSKSVDVALRTASKFKEDSIGKSKEDSIGTSKTSTKSKPDTLKIDKSKPDAPKIGKSKPDAVKIGKSKQNASKVTSTAKDKPSKSGSKSNVNGTGKLKSGSSKVKESEDVKENSTDSDKVTESKKRKSPSSSKAQGSEAKSGKKRGR